jgi:hypothetical protein
MVKRALFIGVLRVVALLSAAAAGVGFDVTGTSLWGLSSGALRIMIFVTFGVFVGLTIWREGELWLAPRPNVQYDGLIPDRGPVTTTYLNRATKIKIGYFFRIALKNNARNPFGANSTAEAMTASVDVYADGKVVDSWVGRWPANHEPRSYPEKFQADRLDLPANNQQAILDIGMRYEGEEIWQGWDNGHYFGGESRPSLQPGCYTLRVTIAPANCMTKELWFELKVPNIPQSDDTKQVVLTYIKKPKLHKGGFQT